jgi:hypothetical protein
MPGTTTAATSRPIDPVVPYYLSYCIHVEPFGPYECDIDSQNESANSDADLDHTATSSGNTGSVKNHEDVSFSEGAGGITSATVNANANGSAKKTSQSGEAAVEGRASTSLFFTVPEGSSVSYSISGTTATANKTDSDDCVSAYVQLRNGNDPLFTQAAAKGNGTCFTATTGGAASGTLAAGRYELAVLTQGDVDTETTGQQVAYNGKASATITFDAQPNLCETRKKTGPGYHKLTHEMKAALRRLYNALDAISACYHFTLGWRSQEYQDQLRKDWHDIADKKKDDKRSYDEICQALHDSPRDFGQCPTPKSDAWKPPDAQGLRVAKGGPAKHSRHTEGEAADITVKFPTHKKLAKYQDAAREAGLCGPPESDASHVELPYKKKPKAEVRCHFPEGPAP